MANPTPIIREDKVLAKYIDLPDYKKYTHLNANEDRDKINASINFLPVHLTVGADGIMTGYEVEQDDGEMKNILDGKYIGSIFQIGTGISFSEYDPAFGAAEWSEFSKDLNETTIMNPGTHDPMTFTPFTKYILYPR